MKDPKKKVSANLQREYLRLLCVLVLIFSAVYGGSRLTHFVTSLVSVRLLEVTR